MQVKKLAYFLRDRENFLHQERRNQYRQFQKKIDVQELRAQLVYLAYPGLFRNQVTIGKLKIIVAIINLNFVVGVVNLKVRQVFKKLENFGEVQFLQIALPKKVNVYGHNITSFVYYSLRGDEVGAGDMCSGH
jgi:hypothetical protein